jgi:hypothetical protein
MTLYTVLAPPPVEGETRPDPIRLVFVKEGFCWPALFIPVIWLVFRRLWIVLALYVALAVAIGMLGERTTPVASGALFFLGWIWFAIEANGLRRWTYLVHGWRLIDVIEARTYREAEIRYFHGFEARMPEVPPPPPPAVPERPPLRLPSIEQGDVVGLFPSPGAAP